MQDPLAKAYRYRKVADEFSNLAKRTSSGFSRGYYQRIAQQYQTLADSELGWRQTDAIVSGTKPAFSAKVWAYREPAGKKYFEVFLDNGTRARIDFLEGLTTQQPFLALSRALDERLGSCSITVMNDLALFDESDGLSEFQKRKLFRVLCNPMNSASASSTISCVG